MEYLQQKGISTRPGTHAVHMLGFYKNTFNIQPMDYPGAYAANEYSMSIPLHNKMVKEDIFYLIKRVKWDYGRKAVELNGLITIFKIH